jgi:5'(3')-deoxyribonucleotidase
MKDGRKIVYVDMDNTICDFLTPFKSGQFKLKYPQSKIGFFLDLEPLEGALEGIKTLQQKYDVWILTRPSIKNTHCYTEKADWIKKYFGEEMLEKLIICPDKSLAKGEYLVDDDHRNGQTEFEGEHIHFGKDDKFMTWSQVVEYLINK